METILAESRHQVAQHPASGSRQRPTRAMAEAAVRTLIEWERDDPDREGLQQTPERVVRAYEEFFAGYRENTVALLATTFEEAAEYDERILQRDIRFELHWEHHIVPILGKPHIGYLPTQRVVDISKLAQLVAVFVKCPQIQKAPTSQTEDILQRVPWLWRTNGMTFIQGRTLHTRTGDTQCLPCENV